MISLKHMTRTNTKIAFSSGIFACVAMLGAGTTLAAASDGASPMRGELRAELQTNRENAQAAMEARRAEIQTNREDMQAAREEKKTETLANRQAKFCSTFLSRVTGQQGGAAEKFKTFTDKRTEKVGAMEGKQADRTAERAGKRGEEDAQRAQWYATLLAKATTDAQKSAVAEFQATMEAAVKTRRAAIDASVEAFRSSVDASLSSRTSGMDAAATALKSASDAAIATAKASCDNGTEPAAVREQFTADMKAARGTFQSARQSLEKVRTDASTLAETKNAAIKSAMETFKSAADAAREALLAAFKGTSEE